MKCPSVFPAMPVTNRANNRRRCAHPAGCELLAMNGDIYCEGCATDREVRRDGYEIEAEQEPDGYERWADAEYGS